MKIWIMTRAAMYDNGEVCTWCEAYASERAAHKALTREIIDFVRGRSVDGFVDVLKEVRAAYRNGGENEGHDAIAAVTGGTLYGDVFCDEISQNALFH